MVGGTGCHVVTLRAALDVFEHREQAPEPVTGIGFVGIENSRSPPSPESGGIKTALMSAARIGQTDCSRLRQRATVRASSVAG